MTFLAVYTNRFTESGYNFWRTELKRNSISDQDVSYYENSFAWLGLYSTNLKGEPPGQSLIVDNKLCFLKGVVFDRNLDNSEILDEISIRSTLEQLARSELTFIYEIIWGRYIALLFNINNGNLIIMRDPMGGIPMYHTYFPEHGIHIFSSDFTTICNFKRNLYLNKACMSLIVNYRTSMPTRLTGFKDIFSLLPGEMMDIRGCDGILTHNLPWWREIAKNNGATQLVKSFNNIEAIFSKCVKKWILFDPNIALHFSGGIDSSTLLGYIRLFNSSRSIVCLNYFLSGGSSDERIYTKMATDHVKAKLKEIDCKDFDISKTMDDRYINSPRPYARVLFSDLDREFEMETMKANCTSAWLGIGGDTLFINEIWPEMIIDAYYNDGLQEMWRIVLDSSIVNGLPLIHTISQCWKHRNSNSTINKWAVNFRSTINKNAPQYSEYDGVTYKLLSDIFPKVKLPGQRRRLLNLYQDVFVSTEMNINISHANINVIMPILSEPIVEAGLKIKVNDLFRHGFDRYIERKIAYQMMPKEIAFRDLKGSGDDGLIRMLINNSQWIQDYLNSGALLREGIISKLDSDIDFADLLDERGVMITEKINILACELWLSRSVN